MKLDKMIQKIRYHGHTLLLIHRMFTENGAVMKHFAGTPERFSGRDYVLALTHGRYTSLNDLSLEGVRYVSNAVRKGKTPTEIAAEIPNPTPQFYLARKNIEKQ